MVIKIIILLNVLVFIGWFLAPGHELLPWMMDQFTVSWVGLTAGRFWTLVTSAFSHHSFFHLLINMYVLQGFGYALKSVLGRSRFLFFYLLAGISGSFMHALLSATLIKTPELPALGASGAIAGIIIFFSLSFPRERLLLLGLIPVGARWAAVMIVALDIWGLSAQSKGGGLPIGHGAHLGGALIGLLYYFFSRPAKPLTNN